MNSDVFAGKGQKLIAFGGTSKHFDFQVQVKHREANGVITRYSLKVRLPPRKVCYVT